MLEVLRFVFERRQARHLWSRKYFVTPFVWPNVYGDGEQLIGLTTINGRPNFYVLRMPSRLTDINGAEFRELLDKVENDLAECVGWRDNGEDDDPQPWPAYDSSGCIWWRIDWSDVLLDYRRLIEKSAVRK